MCFVVKKNGNLYGWGDNSCNAIQPHERFNTEPKEISYENKYLIAENVKKVSTKEFLRNAIFYLKKSGKLYYQ